MCGLLNAFAMDDQDSATDFHHAISAAMSSRTLLGFSDLEDVLLTAGRIGGACMKERYRFKEAPILHSLRSDRRRARTVEERKRLRFMIETKHKQELRIEKTYISEGVFVAKKIVSWKKVFQIFPYI